MFGSAVKKGLLGFVLILTLLTLLSFVWLNSEINQFWGQNTQLVEYSQFNAPQETIVINNINVLSPDASEMLPQRSVIIRDGKISSINSEAQFPENAVLIDGQGKYLIPGLIDSHVHLWQSPNDLLLYIANGVTQVREMNGSKEHLQWKKEIENGRVGPKLFVASNRLNSNGIIKGWFDEWTAKIGNVSAATEADAVVQSISDQGYDAVKVYTFLTNEDFRAVNTAAEKIGIPLLGHLPIDFGLDKFWNANLKELAHIEELVKELNREFGIYDSPNADEFLEFVHSRSADVVSKLVENDIAVVSTLWLMESFANQKADIHSSLESVELAYVNPGISESTLPSIRVMGWLPEVNIYRLPDDYPQDQLAANRVYWETYAKANQILLKAMVDQGVKVMAGTDANVPITVPGFSLHDELKSLTLSGMSPAKALLSATAVPAERMQLKSGKIISGYQANLVILDKNPLQNIDNTKSIDSVIVNGRMHKRQQLDEMLKAVLTANNASRKVDISVHTHRAD